MSRYAMIVALLLACGFVHAQATAPPIVLPEGICNGIQKFDDALVLLRETVINGTEYFAGTRIGRFNTTNEGQALYNAILKACFPAK